MWAVEHWLEGVQIDLDDLIEVGGRIGLDIGVGPEVGDHGHGRLCDGVPTRRAEVGRAVLVEGEERRGRTDFGSHIADGGLAGCGNGVGAGAKVLDNGTGATLDGQLAGDFEDDVFGGGPTIQGPRELDADELWPAHTESAADHDVDGVGAAHADGDHPEAAGVGGVGVGADHHPAGEGVLLENDLVDDARARLPEPEAVLGADGAEEVVDLGIGVVGDREVCVRADACLDQVVAVDRRRHRHHGKSGGHELQQRHLGGCVLHGDPVGVELGIGLAPLEILAIGIGEMVDEDLLGQGDRAA